MSNPICGIVMPISAIEDCDAQHWVDVKDIISDAVREANYEPRLVSTAIEVNIIQARIIQNLYQNPIVICDVSCKNANVMFELGLRLAFDKPTIVIKDDQTGYSFDTSPLEHLTYPRSLRHGTINKFKEELVAKIKGTMAAKEKDPKFSPFLKAFGPIKAVSMETREVPAQEVMLDMLQAMMQKIERMSRYDNFKLEYPLVPVNKLTNAMKSTHRIFVRELSPEEVSYIKNEVKKVNIKLNVNYQDTMNGHSITIVGPQMDQIQLAMVTNIVSSVISGSRNTEN